MPAKSHLENGIGLAGHNENDGMIINLTMPDLQVTPQEQVPRITGVSCMQQEVVRNNGTPTTTSHKFPE
jgi:hypothetical protein